MHIQISLDTKFHLKLTLLNFRISEFYIFNLILILNFSFNTQFWFLEQTSKKAYFRSKTEKGEHLYWILQLLIFELVEIPTFSLNWQFDFLDQICPERYFQSKTEKVNIIIENSIFKLVLVPNFHLNWQFWFFWPAAQIDHFSSNWPFWFFGPNLPKKVCLVENRKSEHHLGILTAVMAGNGSF